MRVRISFKIVCFLTVMLFASHFAAAEPIAFQFLVSARSGSLTVKNSMKNTYQLILSHTKPKLTVISNASHHPIHQMPLSELISKLAINKNVVYSSLLFSIPDKHFRQIAVLKLLKMQYNPSNESLIVIVQSISGKSLKLPTTFFLPMLTFTTLASCNSSVKFNKRLNASLTHSAC